MHGGKTVESEKTNSFRRHKAKQTMLRRLQLGGQDIEPAVSALGEKLRIRLEIDMLRICFAIPYFS
jgi:hypothetical protein